MLSRFQFFVMIRNSVARFGELLFGILSLFAVSTEEPPVLNPLALLMKKILMYPAQVCCPLHTVLTCMHVFVLLKPSFLPDFRFLYISNLFFDNALSSTRLDFSSLRHMLVPEFAFSEIIVAG